MDRSTSPDCQLPTLVLLPGLDGSGVMFRPLVRCLPATMKTVVVTYPDDQLLGYEELSHRIRPLLPAEPFVLLAESFGGPLALMLAASRPSALRGVVLSASFFRNPVHFQPRWLRHLVRPFLFRWFPTLTRVKAKVGGHWTPELRALSIEALAKVRPEVLACRVREALAVDLRDDLRGFDLPILYLRATRDLIVQSHNAKDFRSLLPSIEVKEFDAPHWLLQTQPRIAASEIETFMAKCETEIPST